MINTSNKGMRTIISMLLIALLLTSTTLALGVSPGRTSFNYEEGRTEQVSVNIVNNEQKTMTAKVYADGPFANWITIDNSQIDFTSQTPEKAMSYTITMGPDLQPGLHKTDIKVAEQIKDTSGQLKILPQLGVIHEVLIHVPYPGLYAEAELKTTNAKKGDPVRFFVSIFNLGDQDIKKAHAVIDIYDPNGELYNKITTEAKPILAKDVGELVVEMDSRAFMPGEYDVKATIFYDGQTLQKQSSFSIEEFLIELVSVTTSEYAQGGIAKFNVIVQNIGNRLIEGFFARINLQDKDGNMVANTKSFTIDVPSEEIKETVAYWDTKDIPLGKYTGTLSLQYEDELLEKEITTVIGKDKIEVDVTSPTGLAIIQEESPRQQQLSLSSLQTQLTMIIILLAVLIGVLIWKLSPKKEKPKEVTIEKKKK